MRFLSLLGIVVSGQTYRKCCHFLTLRLQKETEALAVICSWQVTFTITIRQKIIISCLEWITILSLLQILSFFENF